MKPFQINSINAKSYLFCISLMSPEMHRTTNKKTSSREFLHLNFQTELPTPPMSV